MALGASDNGSLGGTIEHLVREETIRGMLETRDGNGSGPSPRTLVCFYFLYKDPEFI